MKTSAEDDVASLRQLFSAERESSFADFTDVYCIDDAEEVLSRFARARRGDPEAALAFLKEDYAWRRSEEAAVLRSTPPADVLEQDPSFLAEYYRRRCVGLDSSGRLTFYQAYAHCVVKKIKTVVPLEKVVRYHLWEQERATAMLDVLKSRGQGDGTMAVILDIEGMTIGKHVNKDFIWLLKTIAELDRNHYPERMGVTYLINCPTAFGIVWRMVLPFIDPETKDKIKIVTARCDWREEVRAALGDAVVERVDGAVDADSDHAQPPAAVARALSAAVVGCDLEDSAGAATDAGRPVSPPIDFDALAPLEVADEDKLDVECSRSTTPSNGCGDDVAALE